MVLIKSDSRRSVLGGGNGALSRDYMPYGSFQSHLDTCLAFTGQYLDRVTGCYLLGNGYRNYSPVLMRFLSPDRLSPFAAGGCNGYAYCNADPVNRVDSSGATSVRPPPPTHQPINQSIGINTGRILNNVFDYAVTTANVAGVVTAVVSEMELLQLPPLMRRTAASRVANASEFWGNAISAVNSLVSDESLPALPAYTNVLSAATGVTAYVELPGRIHGLWQGSPNARAFGNLMLIGTVRASGLDLIGNGVARIGGVLLGAAGLTSARVRNEASPRIRTNVRA